VRDFIRDSGGRVTLTSVGANPRVRAAWSGVGKLKAAVSLIPGLRVFFDENPTCFFVSFDESLPQQASFRPSQPLAPTAPISVPRLSESDAFCVAVRSILGSEPLLLSSVGDSLLKLNVKRNASTLRKALEAVPGVLLEASPTSPLQIFARLSNAFVRRAQVQLQALAQAPAALLSAEDRAWLNRAYHFMASSDQRARQGVLVSQLGASVKRGAAAKSNSMQRILGLDERFVVTASLSGSSRVALRQ
jgi:hypothetical protein